MVAKNAMKVHSADFSSPVVAIYGYAPIRPGPLRTARVGCGNSKVAAGMDARRRATNWRGFGPRFGTETDVVAIV